MKKLVMVIALGAMLGSCGDASENAASENAASENTALENTALDIVIEEVAKIDTATLNSPCACGEAAVPVIDAMIVALNVISGMKDAAQEDKNSAMKKFQGLQMKMYEIEDKCIDDLALEMAGDDCKAKEVVPEKLMALMKETEVLRR